VWGLQGFYPVTRLAPHLLLAYGFFIALPITVGLFVLQIRRGPTTMLSKGWLVPGAISILLFTTFLAMPFVIGMQRISGIDIRHFVRLPFFFAALLEWLMFLPSIVWIILVSTRLSSRDRLPKCEGG